LTVSVGPRGRSGGLSLGALRPEGLAKDPAYAKLIANTATIAQLTGRNITVGVDL